VSSTVTRGIDLDGDVNDRVKLDGAVELTVWMVHDDLTAWSRRPATTGVHCAHAIADLAPGAGDHCRGAVLVLPVDP